MLAEKREPVARGDLTIESNGGDGIDVRSGSRARLGGRLITVAANNNTGVGLRCGPNSHVSAVDISGQAGGNPLGGTAGQVVVGTLAAVLWSALTPTTFNTNDDYGAVNPQYATVVIG